MQLTNVLVRDLPEHVHAALQRKAERRNQSLQQYLTMELRHLAERHELSDVLDYVETRHGGRVAFRQAVEDLGEDARTSMTRRRRFSTCQRAGDDAETDRTPATNSELPPISRRLI